MIFLILSDRNLNKEIIIYFKINRALLVTFIKNLFLNFVNSYDLLSKIIRFM